MADVLGSALLLGITVAAATGVAFVVAGIPPPGEKPHVELEAFVLPSAPDRIVIEHRGGTVAPLRDIHVLVRLDGAFQERELGAALDAGDTAWAVKAPDGVAKTGAGNFAPGDQVWYTSATVRGKRAEVSLLYEHLGTVAFAATQLQRADATRPALVAARTTSNTTLLVTFSEPLYNATKTDFTVADVSLLAVEVLGDGTQAQFTTTAFPRNATPLVSAVASPAGTTDLAGLLLVGPAAVTASDGAAPAILTGPAATATVSAASVAWGTDEASDSLVEFGPTPALGRSTADSNMAPAHSVALAGLSPGTLYYYRVSSADAAGNRVTSAQSTFTTRTETASFGTPSFTEPRVHLIYPSLQAIEDTARVGLSIMNPTTQAIQVDKVRFRTFPPLTGGNPSDQAFFRGPLVNGPGSDAEFVCTWSGTDSDTVTCDPTGTFAVAPLTVKQVVLQFQTSKATSGQYVLLSGEVDVTSPTVRTYTHEINVVHGDSVFIELFALSGTGGNHKAGHASAASGAPVTFTYKWDTIGAGAKTRTRFIVPPGWTNLTVPAQSVLSQMTVFVREPTPTSLGYVDVAQDLPNNVVRELFFQVTPPVGAQVLVLQVDFEGSKEGSSGPDNTFQSLHWFGVSLT